MNRDATSLLNLPQLAKMNIPHLEGEVEKLFGQSDHAALLMDFLQVVRLKGRVSINIGLGQLGEVLESRHYKNMFELNASEEEIERRYNLRERFYPKLRAFIQLFPEVRNGKYGSLNLGNMGSPWPGFGGGLLCIVLKKSFLEGLDKLAMVACLKRYSLAYFEEGSTEPPKEFYSDLAIHEYLPHLTLLKHHAEVSRKQNSWADMVVNAGKFVEIIILGVIGTHSFEEIRCKAVFWEELDSMEANASNDPAPNDDLILNQWKNLKQLCERLSIPLVKYG